MEAGLATGYGGLSPTPVTVPIVSVELRNPTAPQSTPPFTTLVNVSAEGLLAGEAIAQARRRARIIGLAEPLVPTAVRVLPSLTQHTDSPPRRHVRR